MNDVQSHSLHVNKNAERIDFKSAQNVFDTYGQLSKMTLDEIGEWIDSNNIISINDNVEYYDSTIFQRPFAFRSLFNDKCEFQINDTIIWYNNGTLYYLPKDLVGKDLELRKDYIPHLKVFGESSIESQNIENVNDVNLRSSSVHVNSIGPSNQYELPKNTIVQGVWHKYVHELYNHTFNISGRETASELWLVMKLEWKKNAGWKETEAEKRNINVQISGSVGLTLSGGVPISVNTNFYNIIGNKHILLMNYVWHFSNPPASMVWQVSLTGTITQEVVGASGTRWANIVGW